jgi:putative restriction endonuclease
MEAFAVLVEDDESKWQDDTGVLVHSPKRYRELIGPGTRVAYRKGRLKDRAYAAARLSDEPY